MKRLVIIFGLTLIIVVTKSQEYTPFNFDNGEWVCEYDVKVGLFGGPYCVYQVDSVKFFCNGDTIINDTSFKKLYYKGYTDCPTRTYISGYYGAIRNDILNKRVWFNQENGNFLIYDFNIHVGDSVCNRTVFLPVSFDFCGIVISIDSVMYCNRYFKRYNAIDFLNNVHSIIEGIGSPHGLFTTSAWFSDLLCYSEVNNSACPPCKPFLSIANKISNKINIYVNQGNDQIDITSEDKIASIELFDINVKLVYSLNNINVYKTSVSVYQKGVYILRVRIADKYIIKKIVIT